MSVLKQVFVIAHVSEEYFINIRQDEKDMADMYKEITGNDLLHLSSEFPTWKLFAANYATDTVAAFTVYGVELVEVSRWVYEDWDDDEEAAALDIAWVETQLRDLICQIFYPEVDQFVPIVDRWGWDMGSKGAYGFAAYPYGFEDTETDEVEYLVARVVNPVVVAEEND